MPVPGTRSPWAAHEMDDLNADKTARITILEVQVKHIASSINKQSEAIDNVGKKVDNLAASLMDKQLTELREAYEKELAATKEAAEVSSKVKLLWTAGGVIVTAAIALVIAIMKYRFGG